MISRVLILAVWLVNCQWLAAQSYCRHSNPLHTESETKGPVKEVTEVWTTVTVNTDNNRLLVLDTTVLYVNKFDTLNNINTQLKYSYFEGKVLSIEQTNYYFNKNGCADSVITIGLERFDHIDPITDGKTSIYKHSSKYKTTTQLIYQRNTLGSKHIYVYNNCGIKELKYQNAKGLTNYITYYKYDANCNLIAETSGVPGRVDSKTEITYNAQKQKETIITTNHYGAKATYYFNSMGLKDHEVQLSADDGLSGINIDNCYYYTLDAYGNWTTKITYQGNLPVYLMRRTITYRK